MGPPAYGLLLRGRDRLPDSGRTDPRVAPPAPEQGGRLITSDESPDPITLAEQELSEAKHDPRLDRGREAMIADWRTATQAAERARKLGIWGLHELTMSLQREELALGFRRGQPDAPADVAAALDAASERAQLAQADQDNEAAELNAMTLVAMLSALDAMIEELVPGAQEMMLAVMVRNAENEVTRPGRTHSPTCLRRIAPVQSCHRSSPEESAPKGRQAL
jgi:hypothetical protein